VTNTVWAFAIVGLQHTKFLDAVAVELERRTSLFDTQEISNGLWALATLDHFPPDLLHRLESTVVALRRNPKNSEFWTTRSIASVWKRQEMANLAWVCAVFGEFPPDLIRMLYMGLVGVGDNPNPDYVTECHASARLGTDDGISSSFVMSLTYLQMRLDLESDLDIHLPRGFPDDWLRRGYASPTPTSSRGSLTAIETESLFERVDGELRLNTSVLQQAVSAALNLIGFRHVEEFVFDMTTLSNDYGILNAGTDSNGSQLQTEILSLDMANVADRIGIEVDGPGHFITNIDNFHAITADEDEGHVPTEVFRSPNGKTEVVFGWNNKSKRFRIKTNGPTSLKLRILRAMGWKIHNIPFWEWSEVVGDDTAEEEYCRSLLKN